MCRAVLPARLWSSRPAPTDRSRTGTGGDESARRHAWAMWLTSSLLIGALALHRHDPVFIALQASSLTSTALVMFLTHRYRGMSCEGHTPLYTNDGAGDRAADPDGVAPA